MISDKDIQRVLDASNIEEVIGDFVELKKEGSRLKCCCPIHHEKTPSFMIEPSKNMFYCHGCHEGGNAITFLRKAQGMSFVDAVKYIANRYHITIEEHQKPMTAEEQLESRKIEAMLNANQLAARFFCESLDGSDDRARFAREYAFNRWGEKFVRQAGIGFAPGHSKFQEWAKKKGLAEDLLLELGLLRRSKDGRIYDGYYDRVVIPIRSRSNQVVGFTARNLNNDEPKYINSPESLVYKKGKTIFGINIALRQAAKEEMMYLVEGAPDVLRLQSLDINNVIAPLGTAWTKTQFESLSRYNPTLCFIPDIDPPKAGQDFGPGIAAVMKNGITALEAGFRVIVKEIEAETPGTKTDPDSYIRSRYILDEIPKEDFIIWYAGKLLIGKQTSGERADVMKSVAKLLALVKDKDYSKMLIKRLGKMIGVPTTLFQNAVNDVIKGNVEKKQADGNKMMDRELYSRYGFYESRNCYYSLNKDGIEQRWPNFVMQPLFHIKDQLNPKRLYRIKNIIGNEEIIELKQEDLVSIQRFKLRVEGLGNFIWEAKEEQLTKLKGFLYEKTETATEITQLGWQKDEFFAFGNGVHFNGQWVPVDEFGIVRLKGIGNFYLPAASKIYRNERKLFQFERKFIHSELSEVSFRTYTDKMIEVFGDNAKVGICFLLATLFKDIVTAKTKNFPILNLFGPKGSGKSELGHSLMSFFIINNDPPNLSSATDAALADAVAQCANALVHVDEYKNTIELSRREFLKGLYDGVGRTRMNMDRDKKTRDNGRGLRCHS